VKKNVLKLTVQGCQSGRIQVLSLSLYQFLERGYMKEFTAGPPVDCSTLVKILTWRAQNQPGRKAYTFLVDGETEEVSITYKELEIQARAAAARLQSVGKTGDRALLIYPPGLEFITAFFACLLSGIIAVPIYPPHPARLERTMPNVTAVINDAKPTIMMTTSSFLRRTSAIFEQLPEIRSMYWLASDEIVNESAEKFREPGIKVNNLAFIQYTSGSTSNPRGVMVSHGNLIANLNLIKICYEHTENMRGIIWLPPYHDMGLIGGILQPFYVGAIVILMSPVVFLQRPFRWLQAISRFKGTTSGGPNFAYDLCVRKITPEQRATLDLSSWDVAFNGAEPINHETLERFTEYFEPCGFRPETFYPCYGLAETTLIASGGLKSARPIVRNFHLSALEQNKVVIDTINSEPTRSLVGCGRTLPGQEIVIVDPQSLIGCAPDEIGEIWVSGPSIAQGYWNRERDTEFTFKAYTADTKEGPFLRTGDLGFLNDGELFVTGRLKDLIIIDGNNHYPQDIEWTVARSHPALRKDSTAAFSINVAGREQLIAVVEVEPRYRQTFSPRDKDNNPGRNVNHRPQLDFKEVTRTVRKAVAEHHDLRLYDITFLRAGGMPKTYSGKIQRYACKKQYLAGTLDVLEK
jgi:acyl-CoA synthetase (AMP-forming)/AMP-acid ligase II